MSEWHVRQIAAGIVVLGMAVFFLWPVIHAKWKAKRVHVLGGDISSRFIQSLESRIAEQRQDYTERLAEKDAIIKALKVDLAGAKLECDRMRTVLMPFGSPAGAMYAQKYEAQPKPAVVPEFSGPDDWQAELNKMLQKEEQDGIHGEGRHEVHQPRADDGA